MTKKPNTNDDAAWKKRYRAPAVMFTQLARGNPDRGLVMSNPTGVYQLYAWDVPSGNQRALTDRPEGVLNGIISPDGQYVYYLDDQKGNEIGHYVRVPFEGGEPQDITPDMPLYNSFFFDINRGGGMLGFQVADADGFHVYCMKVSPDGSLGERRKLYHGKKLTLGPWLSRDGDVAVVMSSERSERPIFSLIAIDTITGEQVAELWEDEEVSFEAMVFSPMPGDSRIVAATDRTGDDTLLIWDPRKEAVYDLRFEAIEGACRAFDWSPDGKWIVFRTFNKAVQQMYVYHLPNGQFKRIEHTGVNAGPYFGNNQEIWSHWQDPMHPSRLVSFDIESAVQTRTILTAGEVPPGRPWKPVHFTSGDGQEIQAWLCLPEGEGPFPVIMETHGGPEAVTTAQFDPGSQAWMDHGFAYITINYRGSTTFGREFREKIWGDLGNLEVEDMVAAREWLVKQGIAKPDQVFLTGWSYGGYLTLQGLGKYPDLWAGGMAGVAIADWAISYEDSADFLRGYQVAMLGGTPEEKPEQYAASSPVTYVEAVKAPVLIIQGRNDTRTPSRPVEVYEEKMKALGKSIKVHWYDAGHAGSFAQIEQGIEHQEMMMLFAYDILEKMG
jgi:dipeptidyl aminopeptidase/acylaminoacyl peptidase